MKTLSEIFKQALQNALEEQMQLDEALITLGGKAYPKFGHIAIMGGGAGSGKGFIKDKLLGLEGFTFDVDALKLLATQAPKIRDKVLELTAKQGEPVDLFDLGKKGALKDPKNVFKLHEIIGDMLKLDDKRKGAVFASAFAAAADRKPNMIFDVTMKSTTQLQKYTLPLQNLGYDKRNIHVIWVVNDIEVAKAQNQKRDRTVPEFILTGTHQGASQTMQEIIRMGEEARKYFDGDFVLAFNKVKVDSTFVTSNNDGEGLSHITPKKDDKGNNIRGSYIKDANYVYIKRAGKPVDKSKLTAELKAKIGSYVPPSVDWNDLDF